MARIQVSIVEFTLLYVLGSHFGAGCGGYAYLCCGALARIAGLGGGAAAGSPRGATQEQIQHFFCSLTNLFGTSKIHSTPQVLALALVALVAAAGVADGECVFFSSGVGWVLESLSLSTIACIHSSTSTRPFVQTHNQH
jgi:hypothetical protein